MGNQFFFLASFFWVACIAWHIHSTIVAQRHADPQRPAPCLQFLRFHCISWGLPLVSVIVLAVIDEPEFGTLGPLAGCFLALGSGLRLVGTASPRR